MKLVNGLVAQGFGKEATQISIPLLIALGLHKFEGGAELMIGAFVALAWAVYQVILPGLDIRQVRAHKAETRVHHGLHWRTRNSDRAAFILYAPDLAKKTCRQLYA